MENLRTAGERLSKYELEKRHAIEIEDYDRARHKKTLMEDYRKQVYTQVAVDQLLETNGVCLRKRFSCKFYLHAFKGLFEK